VVHDTGLREARVADMAHAAAPDQQSHGTTKRPAKTASRASAVRWLRSSAPKPQRLQRAARPPRNMAGDEG
jgi:hypothetical protein